MRVILVVLVLLVTGGKQSQLQVLSLSLKFDNIDSGLNKPVFFFQFKKILMGPDYYFSIRNKKNLDASRFLFFN